MSPDTRPRASLAIARKEATLFLSSPIAWLFFAAFAAVTLFIVFWGEAFFARNIADVRPMFEWMPILLILLCSTLTMRMWSEERRSGTLEHVLTQSTPLWNFVLGKYLACMGLLLLALLVVLPLPITLSLISDIDWGPVWAGYLATLLLGSAYLAIGLFVSSRTRNQIVSLIGSVVLCGGFWLVGNSLITQSLGQSAGELLQAIGTGARFDAITRGVIDVSDLVYYLSLSIVFLVLNVLMLERERWTQTQRRGSHRRWQLATALLILNALALNLWVGQMNSWRLDTTRGQQYSLSEATRNYLSQLQEPLTLRGYFSARTHPLLSPLVPQMRDLMREMEVAGKGRVRVEFIDPMSNPEAEEEANRQYGIEPVPFQVADRYQSSIVSSYFDVLVQYGDEYEVLSFRDLIDVKSRGEADIDVQLRNPEYDLTRSIRRVLEDFQSSGNVFASIATPVTLTAYVSSNDRLPSDLVRFKSDIQDIAQQQAEASGGKLTVRFEDPQENGSVVASQLANDYGLRPMSAGLFSSDTFWFHLLLSDGQQQVVQLPLDDLSASAFESNLDAGLKRFATGFTHKVGVVLPDAAAAMQPGMPPASVGQDFQYLQEYLRSEYDLVQEDISDGMVSSDVELLILAAPENLDERSLFAVDQFLMKGGTVIAASSPYSASLTQTGMTLQERTSGMEDWLAQMGIDIGKRLVMDPQNAAFPVPVSRNVGGMQLQELRMLDYPYFVDVRGDGVNTQEPVLAGLDQVTIPWASPITLSDVADGDEENAGAGASAGDSSSRQVSILLASSPEAWVSESTDILPRLDDPQASKSSPWPVDGDVGEQILAVSSTGRFDSYFAGKPSPLATSDSTNDVSDDAANGNASGSAVGNTPASTESGESAEDSATLAQSMDTVIERSTEAARLIVIASNDLLRDQINQMTGSANGTANLAPFQLIANAVDVALDDSGLAAIRSRGQFNRTLPPMDESSQRFWEYLNYVLAALAIGGIYAVVSLARTHREKQQLAWLNS
ncbi:Gldg family protein [Granulosicoccus sp. 3-233]|uniref:Gldg family protein n=1 Tax=Granulosicoccus sp. 3-233 TaxID=3417969 RepID=UPI003D335C19